MKNFQYSHFGLAGMELYSKHWSRPRRRRSEKRKKKDTARTPESGDSDRYVGHRYFAKNGVSLQPRSYWISTTRCMIPFFFVICSGERLSFLVRNRTISTSSVSIEKQVLCQQRVQQVELLSSVNDLYGGVVVNIEKPMDSEDFSPLLRASISHWRQQVYIILILSVYFMKLLCSCNFMKLGCNLQGKRAVWIKLPIERVNLVEAAVKVSFKFPMFIN